MKEKTLIINELRQGHKLSDLLKVAAMPRSVYYYWRKAVQRPDPYVGEKRHIEQIYHHHKGRYGYRRITLALRSQGCWLNHKTVQRLMKQLRLKCTVRPKRYRSYKGSGNKFVNNILDRQFKTSTPNTKWATDVTEFNVDGKKVFLSPILDLYNQEIISYEISKSPNLQMVLKMLKKATHGLKDTENIMLHSDQGWQYQTPRYHRELAKHGIVPSMSRKGNCHDNAVMEGFFGILKSELLQGGVFESFDVLVKEVKKYIEYYNYERIKEKLRGLSPVDYRLQALNAA